MNHSILQKIWVLILMCIVEMGTCLFATGYSISYTYPNKGACSPSVAVEEISYDFKLKVGEMDSKSLTVIGKDIVEDMELVLDGMDKNMFSYSIASDFDYRTGGDITVNYMPTAVGNHLATLTISSGTASIMYIFNGEAAYKEYEFVGDGSEDNPYTVADVLELENSTASTKHWIKGYIVATPLGGRDGVLTMVEFEDFNVKTALVLADDSLATNLAKMIPVELPVGNIRNELNLVDNPINLKQELHVYGTLEAYFLAPGVKSVFDYKLFNSDPNVHVETVKDSSIVYTDNRHIIILAQAGTTVDIYTVLGQKIHSLITQQAITSIPINIQGVLLVKVGEQAVKLLNH